MRNDNKPVQAVLLDLDGTLVDSIAALKAVYLKFLACYEVRGSDEEFKELNGPSLHEIVEILKERHALSDTSDGLLRRYKELLAEEYANAIQPCAGATEFLSWLSSCDLLSGLATSSPRSLVDAILSRHGWMGAFDGIVTGDDVSKAKPDPEIYLRLLCSLGAQKEYALAVEDSVKGVESALRAGLRVIRFAPCDEDGCDLPSTMKTVNSFEAVKELIVQNMD